MLVMFVKTSLLKIRITYHYVNYHYVKIITIVIFHELFLLYFIYIGIVDFKHIRF